MIMHAIINSRDKTGRKTHGTQNRQSLDISLNSLLLMIRGHICLDLLYE